MRDKITGMSLSALIWAVSPLMMGGAGAAVLLEDVTVLLRLRVVAIKMAE